MKTTLKSELENSGLLPIFEIPVINKSTKEFDYILCNIYINDKEVYLQRVGLTEEEESSNKIATNSVDIDEDYDLDWHLNNLYEEVQHSILNSTLYRLK